MNTVAVIPARYASTRLPRKLLLDLKGKSILQRCYEQVAKSNLVSKVCIATDNQEIYDLATSFNAEVHMTSEDHQSGTDRIAELALKNRDWDLIVNVQGDEPFINPKDIDTAIRPFVHDPKLEMSSLYHLLEDQEEIQNPNNVKLVTDLNSQALYFSRAPIAWDRDANAANIPAKKHIGLYAYKRETLINLSQIKPSPLEQIEKLEQLRALENGIQIKMLEVENYAPGIDTEEDYQKALELV